MARLEAERDIFNLFARYAAAVDVSDPDGVGLCFASDGRLELVPSSGAGGAKDFRGRDAISAFIGAQPPSPDVFQQHGVGEARLLLAADGTTASCDSNFVVFKRSGGGQSSGAPFVHAFGTYADELTLSDAGWLFQSRRAVYDGVRAVAS
ncbi:nuclear transport factor 2 family protein [Microbacterium lacus]|uniref:nuclear transport factor 2 family protein n=1 Tax=Microbacterium lacus TaxID=415217 RepID=UPI00384B1E7B